MGLFSELLKGDSRFSHIDIQALLHWIQEQGGLAGIESKFQQSGLSHLTKNWLTQQNTPSSVENTHLVQAFGRGTIDNLANNLGVDAQTASSLLITYLPSVLALLEKEADAGGLISKVTGLLKGFLSRPS
ncbi:YidB family protein [Serratia marcescens]|uniref:YidB family protein n=1 Tax=Serratia marcescens TaxID=615 RepID=UPI00217A3E29|nr:YidB family protein [Serratia marcescens]CAI1616957.1 Uncharacterized protein conserved in bacteria [Serratia marcescens]